MNDLSGEVPISLETDSEPIPYLQINSPTPLEWQQKIDSFLRGKNSTKNIAIRFFSQDFLRSAIKTGSDRRFQADQDRTSFHGPDFDSSTKKDYSEQDEIMKKLKLSPEDVTWAFKIDNLDSPRFPEIELGENTALIIYDKDKLEELSGSFFQFKTQPKDAALLVLGHKSAEELNSE